MPVQVLQQALPDASPVVPEIFKQLIGGFIEPVCTPGEMQQYSIEVLGNMRVDFSQIGDAVAENDVGIILPDSICSRMLFPDQVPRQYIASADKKNQNIA